MNKWFKFLCYFVWAIFVGVELYMFGNGPGDVRLLTGLALILGGISLYLYAIYVNRKGLSRYLTLVPVFIGICLLFDLKA